MTKSILGVACDLAIFTETKGKNWFRPQSAKSLPSCSQEGKYEILNCSIMGDEPQLRNERESFVPKNWARTSG